MNERFKEIAKQAEFSEKDLHIQGDNFQKFAELMVQDCIRTLRSNGYDDAAKCLQDIHCGIENPV